MLSKIKNCQNVQLISITIVLFILLLFFSITTSSFLSVNNFLNLVNQLAPYLIVAVVMTFVITTGGIDLSVGSILAVASALTAILLDNGVNSLATLIIVLSSGALFGLINGYFIAFHNIPPFIVTLAAMIYIRGIALFLTGGYSIAISKDHWLVFLGRGSVFNIPVSALIALLVVVLGVVFFSQTKYGNYVTGIGANAEAVRRAGVDIRKVKFITYGLSGLAASLAGIIIATRLGSGSSNIGTAFELDIIAAVVLGGTSLFGGYGTILGSFVGVILIGVINNGLTLLHVSPFIIQIVEGVVLLLAVFINIRLFGNTYRT